MENMSLVNNNNNDNNDIVNTIRKLREREQPH